MYQPKLIQVFEHERLTLSRDGFKKHHLDSLLSLNDAHKGRYLDGIRDGVKFKQYVGIIQIGGLCIEILPKADRNENDKAVWRDILIRMLKVCNKLKVDSFENADVKKQNRHLLDVYFEIYLNELESLIHRGLIKKYRKKEGNLTALKGKLQFAQHTRRNLIHKERFYTKHQVYDSNHLLHSILRMALEVVQTFTRGGYLANQCKRVSLDFPDVSDIKITLDVFSKINLGRKEMPYTRAIEIAKILLLNINPDIAQGKEKMLALLFDMNKLWEEFVLRMMKKAAQEMDEGIMIIGQSTKPFWGGTYLQPDIVIEKNGKFGIIDTKWKNPDMGISINDLRQIFAYNKFWGAQIGILLFPGSSLTYNNVFEETNVIKKRIKGGITALQSQDIFISSFYNDLINAALQSNDK